jgi:hypothetical protein
VKTSNLTKKYRFQVVESRGRFKNSADLWLLKQLIRGQADIGASSILVTHDRVGLAEYTVAIEKFRYILSIIMAWFCFHPLPDGFKMLLIFALVF